MKKLIALLTLLLVLSSFAIFASSGYSNEGYIDIKAFISALDKDYSFDVVGKDFGEDGINLKGNPDILCTGDGIEVGSWIFNSENLTKDEMFTVSYSYEPLRADVANFSFDYDIILLDRNRNLTQESDTTTFTATGSSSGKNDSEQRFVKVRLTEAATETLNDAPIDTYTSRITIELTSNS